MSTTGKLFEMRPRPWEAHEPYDGCDGHMQWSVWDDDGNFICECDGKDEGELEARAIVDAVNRTMPEVCGSGAPAMSNLMSTYLYACTPYQPYQPPDSPAAPPPIQIPPLPFDKPLPPGFEVIGTSPPPTVDVERIKRAAAIAALVSFYSTMLETAAKAKQSPGYRRAIADIGKAISEQIQKLSATP